MSFIYTVNDIWSNLQLTSKRIKTPTTLLLISPFPYLRFYLLFTFGGWSWLVIMLIEKISVVSNAELKSWEEDKSQLAILI